MTSEQALLARLRASEDAALDETIRTYTPYVCAILRRQLGSFCTAEDVEELASNVFFSLWQHRKRLKTGHLRGWLSKVALNEARSYLRRQKLETVNAEDWLSLPDAAAVRLEDEAERRELAAQALSLLDEQTREIFLRCYAQRQTVAEIAQAMQMNVSAVKSRLQRGRKKLQRSFDMLP